MKFIATLIVCLVIGAIGFGFAARSGMLTPTETALRTKYMLPTSKIIEIDGEPIHYSDEGQGTPIVLIHGSFGSLLMWNDWVKKFGGRYRIVRFDRPPMGLSGPDPKDRYGAGREAEIVDGLVTKLGLDKFFLVGTSSGGASELQYAAEHPDHIKGIVLANISVGPMVADPKRNTWLVRQIRTVVPLLNGWHPRVEWRQVLERNIVDHSKITDALVDEWTDLNNRPASFIASQQPRPAGSPFARAPGDLAKITAPALILWSENDSEIPPLPNADDAMKLIASQDKTKVIIPRCEHMMPLDCGAESAAAALAFFDRVAAADQPPPAPPTP